MHQSVKKGPSIFTIRVSNCLALSSRTSPLTEVVRVRFSAPVLTTSPPGPKASPVPCCVLPPLPPSFSGAGDGRAFPPPRQIKCVRSEASTCLSLWPYIYLMPQSRSPVPATPQATPQHHNNPILSYYACLPGDCRPPPPPPPGWPGGWGGGGGSPPVSPITLLRYTGPTALLLPPRTRARTRG